MISPFELETGKLYANGEKQYYKCSICGKTSYSSMMVIPTDFVANFLDIFARLVIAKPIEDDTLCECPKDKNVLLWLYDKKDLEGKISEISLQKVIKQEQMNYFKIAIEQGFLGNTLLEKINKNILKGTEKYARN